MILCMTLLALQTPAAPAARVDWPVFLARHDLVWDRLPTRWGESAFIGNGRVGATIDAPGGVLGWTVNRTDFVHDQSRFPIGRVVVQTTGTVQRGDARLTLWDAEASGTVTTDRGEVRWRSFAAAQPSVIVIVLEARGGERGGDVHLDWVPAEARPPRKVARKEAFAPEDLHPPPTVTRSPAEITSVQTFLGGGAHAESIVSSSPSPAGRGGQGVRTFYISIGQGRTDREALAEARAATREAARLGVARLTAAHRKWWHAYYPASFLTFPDARLEAYYWIQYRYQMDDHVLRERVYPLLKLAIGNYLAYVERGDDGRWHLPPTHSPELATVPDANYDLALLKWGLETLIAGAERLRLDEPLLTRWRDVLANLAPFPTDSAGLMVGRGRPWQQSHRHYSHLLAIYPLRLITPDRSDQRALIETSLATWERDISLFRGYSFTGGAAMHAQLGHGDVALTRLNQYLDAPRYMEPNTFYAEAGPVIETPLSAAASIQELFLQDWGGALRIFPAVPAAWSDAAFDHLRAEGAFLVSGARRGGRTAWVRIASLAGEPCRLVVPDWDTAVVRAHAGPVPRVTRDSTGAFVIDLPRAASVVLAPDVASPPPAIRPIALPPAARNPFPILKDGLGAAQP